MTKVFVVAPHEGWIIDRFVDEWSVDNADITVEHPDDADVVWLLADFCWRHLPVELLRRKRVLTSVHHIVPEKFDRAAHQDFMARDAITSAYHVYNDRTLRQVVSLTRKPVHLLPYWANQRLWHSTGTREALRAKFKLPSDAFIIGSFQRDTEGADLVSPKLEKGPDLLVDALVRFTHTHPNVHVLLAGWRRQYVIRRLIAASIAYSYFERPEQKTINELYQTLDLYPVTARHEGGPQALIEAGLLNVPVVSRPVGIAEQVLPNTAINDRVDMATPCVPNVGGWLLPHGYKPYRDLLERM